VSPRAEVVATAREMLRLGLVVGAAGNVSAREGDAVRITPRALPYVEMTEQDIVELSLGGEVIAGAREPSSEWRVHTAIYSARPEVGAIVHTHSVYATAWSCLGELLDTGVKELVPTTGGAVRTAADAPPGTDAIARAAVEALDGRRALLLAHHGVVGVGESPARALVVCQVVERQAQIAWLLRNAGSRPSL
jgi:L-fuculose-phosphate aldolase